MCGCAEGWEWGVEGWALFVRECEDYVRVWEECEEAEEGLVENKVKGKHLALQDSCSVVSDLALALETYMGTLKYTVNLFDLL